MDNDEVVFQEFTKSPEFVIIRTNEPMTQDRVKGNIVKLVFDKDYGTRKNNVIIEDIELMEPAALVGVDTSNFSTDSIYTDKNEDVIIKDNETLLKDYINALPLPEHLKKKTMLTMIDMLIREVTSDD